MKKERSIIIILCAVICILLGSVIVTMARQPDPKEARAAAQTIDSADYLSQVETMLREDGIAFENLTFLGQAPPRAMENRGAVRSYIAYAYENTRDHSSYAALAPVEWEGDAPKVLYRYDSFIRLHAGNKAPFAVTKVTDCYDSVRAEQQFHLLYGYAADDRIAAVEVLSEKGTVLASHKIAKGRKGFLSETAGSFSGIRAVDKDGKVIALLDADKGEVVWE